MQNVPFFNKKIKHENLQESSQPQQRHGTTFNRDSVSVQPDILSRHQSLTPQTPQINQLKSATILDQQQTQQLPVASSAAATAALAAAFFAASTAGIKDELPAEPITNYFTIAANESEKVAPTGTTPFSALLNAAAVSGQQQQQPAQHPCKIKKTIFNYN
jgi:hypothetical protein